MSRSKAFYVAALMGFASYWLAIGVGIPAWRDWEPGDASDIAVFVGIATYMLARRP